MPVEDPQTLVAGLVATHGNQLRRFLRRRAGYCDSRGRAEGGAPECSQCDEDEAPLVDTEGYLDTGDLAWIDAAGNLTIAGRVKDLIKSGGEWINPKEIEDIVGNLPGVALAAVIASDHPKWGERPVLIVEPRRSQALTEQLILAALRGKVPDWWLPDQIVFIDRMPVAPTGKIDKRQLRASVVAARTDAT